MSRLVCIVPSLVLLSLALAPKQPTRDEPLPATVDNDSGAFVATTQAAATGPAVVPPEVARAMGVILDRYVRSLLPADAADAHELSKLAAEHAASLQPNGVWPDVSYDDGGRSTWKTREHLERTLVIAKAYRQGRASGQPSAHLLTAATRALRGWIERDPRNSNWWWNEIGVPQLVGEVMALLQPELDPADIDRGLDIMRRNRWATHTGANLVWGVNLQVLRACLRPAADSEALLDQAYARLFEEIRVESQGREGIQADFSFHQHGPQFYSGSYGLVYGNDVARAIAFAWGTRYQAPAEKMDVLAAFLLDGQQWMVRGEIFDHSALGREITREGKTALARSWLRGPIAPTGAAYGLLNAVGMLAKLPVPRQAELAAFAARLRGDSAMPLNGNRHFWASDYMAHHRPGFFTSVRMFSSRLLNTENVNGEGPNAHHLADGANLTYRTGDEYRDLFPAWNWDHVPGTTVEVGFRQANPTQVGVRGTASFVGGASDGSHGIAAMQLQRGALAARKVWVMFDRQVVCLGTDIQCESSNAVVTTVNQCRLTGAVMTSAQSGATTRGTVTDKLSWVHHDGIGYVFPGAVEVRMEAAERTGQWSDIGAGRAGLVRDEVFSLWFEHGANVRNGDYAYVVLPNATIQETAAAASRLPVRIVANEKSLQAVHSPAEEILAVAFWAAGEIAAGSDLRMRVDQPCVALLSRERSGPDAGALRLTLSNPENNALTVNVKLPQQLEGPGCNATADGTEVRVELPSGTRAGSSVTILLRPRR